MVTLVIELVVVAAGLPLLVRMARGARREGLEIATADGAWPNVCWRDPLGGYAHVVAFVFFQQVVVLNLLAAPLMAMLAPQSEEQSDPAGYRLAQSLMMVGHWVVTCGFILTYLWAVWRARPAAVGLTFRGTGRAIKEAVKGLLAAMPVTLVALLVPYYIYFVVTGKEPGGHPVLDALQAHPKPWVLAGLWIAAGVLVPITEELFFRGLVQTSLLRTGQPWLAIAIQGVLFGVVHLGTPKAVLPMIVFGVALGYVFHRTRTLVAPIAMHMGFNLFNLALATLPMLTAKPAV